MRYNELLEQRIDELGLIIPGVNTTVDVKPGETKRQAAKFGNAVTDLGLPPIIQSNGKIPKIV
jgi:hypothetical protein